MPRIDSFTWDDLCGLLDHHRTSPKKDWLPAWSPAEYKAGETRCKDNVVCVHCLTFDFDKGIGTEAFKNSWANYEFIAHSTYSHTVGFPKWRVVFPLVEPIAGEDWDRTYQNLAFGLGRGLFDPACRDACRLYFVPACPKSREREAFVWGHAGDWVNPSDFPDISAEQKAELETVLHTDRDGRPMSYQGKIDYRAIAEADIPYGFRHEILIKAIKRARMEDWPIEHIRYIVDRFHESELRGFGSKSKQESLGYYFKEINKAWRKYQPDPTFVKEEAHG